MRKKRNILFKKKKSKFFVKSISTEFFIKHFTYLELSKMSTLLTRALLTIRSPFFSSNNLKDFGDIKLPQLDIWKKR